MNPIRHHMTPIVFRTRKPRARVGLAHTLLAASLALFWAGVVAAVFFLA